MDDDDDLPAFRSAGTLNTPSSSRARMLSQQREIELKKRQAQMQNGGKQNIFPSLTVELTQKHLQQVWYAVLSIVP
jgi:hypothetical protein